LEKLAVALDGVVDKANMEAGLARYQPKYAEVFCDRTLKKLGFTSTTASSHTLLTATLDLLEQTHVSYSDFFATLTREFEPAWQTDETLILAQTVENSTSEAAAHLQQWRKVYQECLAELPAERMEAVRQCLQSMNPMVVLHRPVIESVWEPIAQEDNWQPFYDLLKKIQHPTMA